MELLSTSSNCQVITRFIETFNPRLLRPFLTTKDLYEYFTAGLIFCETLLMFPNQFFYNIHDVRVPRHSGAEIMDTIYDMVKAMIAFGIYTNDTELLDMMRIPLVRFYP